LDYKNLLTESPTPFESNTTNTWNTKFEILSTRNQFDLQTGDLNTSLHTTGSYYCPNIARFRGISHPENYELIIYTRSID